MAYLFCIFIFSHTFTVVMSHEIYRTVFMQGQGNIFSSDVWFKNNNFFRYYVCAVFHYALQRLLCRHFSHINKLDNFARKHDNNIARADCCQVQFLAH
jgi:peptidoglycan biosynthesis protein MviN/MurJ (putative lipid II flippase)